MKDIRHKKVKGNQFSSEMNESPLEALEKAGRNFIRKKRLLQGGARRKKGCN